MPPQGTRHTIWSFWTHRANKRSGGTTTRACPCSPCPNSARQTRPQTEADLAEALADRQRVYALFWATDEADPAGIVEGWLGRNRFKSMESWQGNLRLAVYDALPAALTCSETAVSFDPSLRLEAVCRPANGATVAAGEPVLIQLRWRADAPVGTRYKTSLQLLDARNQVVAQQDSEPAGGTRPTDGWTPGEVIDDNHGLPVPYGTPPGEYRLILAVYDPMTGQRLSVTGGNATDFVDLGAVTIAQPASPLPADLLPIRHRQRAALGPLVLLGYDQFKRGFAHAPETPLAPGDPAHFTLYWQAPDPLPATWPADLTFTLTLGEQQFTAPLAGGAYPTGSWRPGEVVRGEFDLPFDGTGERATLTVAGAEMRLAPLPTLP